MKIKLLFLALLSTITLFSQTQIGDDIDGEAEYDDSGKRISISSDGSVIAIGAYNNDGNGNASGHVRVYENLSGVWTQIGPDIDGDFEQDNSGRSVSLSSDGSILAIGANEADGNGYNSGHVRVYENISGVWTQVGADIDGEAVNDNSGWSVSLSSDGSIVAIGARSNDGNGEDSGHVRVFQYVSGVWTQIGDDIDGEAAGDRSGYSLSLSSDGSVVAIGSRMNEGNGVEAGHVRVYQNISNIWTQIGEDIDGEAAGDYSGSSISLSSDGSILAIGANNNDGNGNRSGHVRVYQNISNAWTQIGEDIDGEAADDRSGPTEGVSLSADGSILAIGADNNDGNGEDSGHVRIYQNVVGVWIQIGEDIDGEAADDGSGQAVRVSSDGNIVAIGGQGNDDNGEESGHVRVYDLSAIVLSVEYNEISKNLTVFPNPTKGAFSINFDDTQESLTVRLLSVTGQEIETKSYQNTERIQLELNQPSGVYLLEIWDEQNNRAVIRLVKE